MKVQTGNAHLDRLQDHLKDVLDPMLANPVLGMRDWRFSESTPTGGAARQLQLQYRGAATSSAPLGTWTTVFSLNLTAALTQGDLLVASAAGVLGRLAAGTSGYVLTSNGPGAAPSWQAASGGSGGWKQAVLIDFTSLPTQNLLTGGNGNKTIGGYTFVAGGTANASLMQVTNGIGLQITLANTNWAGVVAHLTDLVASFQPLRDDFQLWLYFAATNMAPNFSWANAVIGNMGPWPAGFLDHTLLVGPRNNNSNAITEWRNDNNAGISYTSTGNLTDNVIAIHCHNDSVPSVRVLSGNYSSGFPSWATLPSDRGTNSLSNFNSPGAGLVPTSNLGVGFIANSGNGMSITLKQLQLTVRQ